MTATTLISVLSLAGVFAFAISGGLQAVRQSFDLFGIVVIALTTAIGGGTLRDVLLDVPVWWLGDTASMTVGVAAAFATFALPALFENWRSLRWFDAAGMALFAVLGAAKAMSLGYGPLTVAIMGVMTATAGGVIRDMLCGVQPLLLRQDIYATAALAGSGALWGLVQLGVPLRFALILGASLAFTIRICAIQFKWSLPKARS